MHTELLSVKTWTIPLKYMSHRPKLFLSVQSLEESEDALRLVELVKCLNLFIQQSASVASELCGDVRAHDFVQIVVDDFLLRAVQKEFNLWQCDVWNSEQRPLNDAGIEVTREVAEWSLWVHSERSHRKGRLFSAEDQHLISHIPAQLLRIVATRDEEPGNFRGPLERSDSILMVGELLH